MHRLSTAALNALRNYGWPGGYSELQARRALARARRPGRGNQRRRGRAPDRQHAVPAPALALPLELPLREAREAFERLYFDYHLRQDDGNMTRLAEKTGLERTHLYRKLKALGIHVGRRDEEPV